MSILKKKQQWNRPCLPLFLSGRFIPLHFKQEWMKMESTHFFKNSFPFEFNKFPITDDIIAVWNGDEKYLESSDSVTRLSRKHILRERRHDNIHKYSMPKSSDLLALLYIFLVSKRQQYAWRVDFGALPINHHRIFSYFFFFLVFLSFSLPNFGRINKQMQLFGLLPALLIHIPSEREMPTTNPSTFP